MQMSAFLRRIRISMLKINGAQETNGVFGKHFLSLGIVVDVENKNVLYKKVKKLYGKMKKKKKCFVAIFY
jgi:hypothetical protein